VNYYSAVPRIVEEVERHYKLEPGTLAGRSRKAGIAKARHIAAYLSYMMTNESMDFVGAVLGARDHSTIHHSVRFVETDAATMYEAGFVWGAIEGAVNARTPGTPENSHEAVPVSL